MYELDNEARQYVLAQLEDNVAVWSRTPETAVMMRDYIEGATSFATRLLISANHTMTEAERLVAEAVERAKAKAPWYPSALSPAQP